MSNKKIVGLTLAATAALAFTVIPATSFAADSTKVPCYHTNACKGKSSGKTADNACKGQNSCKGKGAPGKMMKKKMTAEHCAKKHGTTTAPTTDAPAAAPAAAPAEAPATN